MDADAVYTGRVYQEQQTRPVISVDAIRKKSGRVRAEEQARKFKRVHLFA